MQYILEESEYKKLSEVSLLPLSALRWKIMSLSGALCCSLKNYSIEARAKGAQFIDPFDGKRLLQPLRKLNNCYECPVGDVINYTLATFSHKDKEFKERLKHHICPEADLSIK